MSTYTQILFQIVFSTMDRMPTLNKKNRDELYKYIWGVLKNKNCHLYRIGGVEDHIHLLFDLHPTVSLAGLVKDIKLAAGKYIKENNLFPLFTGWQEGYGAFTYSISEKDRLIEYIKNQEGHHKVISFQEEFRLLLGENGIVFEEKYF